MIVRLRDQYRRRIGRLILPDDARPTRARLEESDREVFLHWDGAVDDAGKLRRCLGCSCQDLFQERAFPQVTAFVVVMAFAGAVISILGFATPPVLIAMCVVLACKQRSLSDDPLLRKAVAWQGVHVAEHVLLTVTWLMFGKTIGISTFFGLVAAGPFLSSYRVWWHFVINLIVTVYAARALKGFAEERLLYPDVQPVVA